MVARNRQLKKPASRGVIALDLGGTKLAGAIFDPRGTAHHRLIAPLEKRAGREVGALITAQVRALLKTAATERMRIEAIGICVPGISRRKSGTVWAPNIPGWKNYPLRKEISSAVGDRRIRVAIDSDRACYILGEKWRGAARDCEHAIFLAVGTGIGAGILADEQILRGADDIAGAIGWMALDRPFSPGYISCGCFESRASGAGIARTAMDFARQKKGCPGMLAGRKALTARDVFNAFKANDSVAKDVLQQAIELWGMAAANLVSLFNPEKIIFGGGVFGPGLRFLPAIRAEARKWAQPVSIRKVKFEASRLGSEAGLYGAGYLALRSLSD